MKRILSFISVILIALSCERSPDPSIEYLRNYYFSFSENNLKKYLAGDLVSDSIKLIVYNYNATQKDSVNVIFDVVKGGGTVTQESDYSGEKGYALTGWRLGSATFEQKLRARSYDLSGHYLTSAYLIEYGFRKNAWDTCTVAPDSYINSLVSDTVSGVTFMISGGVLYRQGERYFDWNMVSQFSQISSMELHKDSNGVIYVSTSSGDILKSADHGTSWLSCTKPFPDYPYFIYTSVANDNSLWAFEWNHPTKFSKDGGTTWTETGSNLYTFGYGDIFRLKDGSLLFHGSNCCSLNRSLDDGLTWTKIATPGYSTKVFVSGNDEITLITQENGVSFYRSTDYAATFTKVFNVYPDWGTSRNSNVFTRWKNFYYVLVPGYGILKSPDLIHYSDYWRNSNLNDLFLDNNGVLIAKDWGMSKVYYRKNMEE